MNEVIKEKVSYCLNCKIKPCELKGCPLGNHIPDMIRLLKEEKYDEAYKEISKTTVLPGICGRICPHKKQCQGSCVRGIKDEPVSIGDLEAFTFDKAVELKYRLVDCYEKVPKNGKKVAIIGGGPAGLTCAAFLAKEGVDVTIYEKYDKLGGILVHGIPDFRLPRDIINETIDRIIELGIKVKYNEVLGKTIDLDTLKNQYDAIFLSVGANKSSKMGVEGETLEGVYGGNELLEEGNYPDFTGKKVAVIGGGNVAMDCSRTIKRLGAKEVKVIYRRAEKQMPAEEKEISDAKKEGIEFLFQNNIAKIIGENHVEKLELIKTKLVKKEGEDREVPVNIDGSNYVIDIDNVVMALGSQVSDEILTLGLTVNKWGNIIIDEEYRTSDKKIYAGGDLAGIKSTVAWAARSGRETAESILKNWFSI